MKLSVLLPATLLAIQAPSIAALGINCRGSSTCDDPGWKSNQAIRIITEKISTIKDNAWYDNGAQIACSKKYSQEGYICAFLQNTKGYDGKRIKPLADHLNNRQDDKCNNCGSVPTEPGNDVSKGQLTFNFVDEDKLQDRCPYFERAINSVQLCKASNE